MFTGVCSGVGSKSDTGNDSGKGADLDFLSTQFDLLNIKGPKDAANLLWALSYNEINPFVRDSHR